jgi:hypothetical protein
MGIQEDFLVNSYTKLFKHTSGTTVYTANAIYSYLQDMFDEIGNTVIDVPMSAQTPTEYTLINGWFIPEDSFKYIRGGAIKTVGWDTAINPTGITILYFSTYTDAVPSDIGRLVISGTATGTLLDYDNTLKKWWVRKGINSLSGSVSVVSGVGGGTVGASKTGEALFANIYSLGLLEATTTNILYVEQNNPELTNNQIAQYWPAGHIDLLVKVKEASVPIDGANVRIYCREYTDLYTHFAVDLSSGGRNPIPLGTADDSNNTTSDTVVSGWNDVTVTFGTITRDLLDGTGPKQYNVEIDCGTRPNLLQVYERLKLITSRNSGFTINGAAGQYYRVSNPSYAENTTAPFGSYAGGIFFGARGVWLKNVPNTDRNNYKLIDAAGLNHNAPYKATGSLVFGSNLVNDVAAKVTMYFASVPGGNYGTINAIIVKDAENNDIQYSINGASSIDWSFDFDANTQGGRTVGTETNVIVTACGLNTGKQITVTHTIKRATGQIITLLADTERTYINQ